MSEDSQPNDRSQCRPLHPFERELIARMLMETGFSQEFTDKWESVPVKDLQDGEMGSVRFITSSHLERYFGKVIAQAEYIDEDGVPVSIVINVDQEDEIFEVDFWKFNFSPLQRYPKASDLKMEVSLLD